ncbi:MAG: hypothetical protein ACE5GS_03135 [Kiloniellaceae bacterium]
MYPPQRTAPTVLRAQAPAHIVHGVLEPELCRELIRYWEAGQKMSDVVAVSLPSKLHAMPDLKKRTDVSVSESGLKEALQTRIKRRLVPEISKVFNYRVTNFEGVRI